MNNFKTAYPTFVLLIALLASVAKDETATGESQLQKLESTITLVPQVLMFLPQVSALKTEAAALKSDPTGIAGGVELMVTELAFTSPKATGIINSAFPWIDWLVSGVTPTKNLIAAVEA